MQIIVLRHGESEADIRNVHEGRADFNLTERGRVQAKRTAAFLKSHYDIDKIYASPLKRAKQTAEALAQATGKDIWFEEELMEFNNGLLAGLSFEEADEKYPKIPNLPIHESRYGMESELEFRYRAERILSKIVSENSEDSVIAIVTHGGMIQQLYRAFLGLPVTAANQYFVTGDTGFHEWIIKDEKRIVLKANYLVEMFEQ